MFYLSQSFKETSIKCNMLENSTPSIKNFFKSLKNMTVNVERTRGQYPLESNPEHLGGYGLMFQKKCDVT